MAPPPVAIGFARNQADPRRASLTTLLPAADHAFQLLDPVRRRSADRHPGASRPRRAQLRSFADFAALPTASGLVITPYADDLPVTRRHLARHHRPARRPGADAAADAGGADARGAGASGDGPSYLNFADWGQASGGSFLATERDLTQAVSRSRPHKTGTARLKLARFYLANGFAAEALGLINLIQASDPGAGAATSSSPPCGPPPIT